MHWSDRERQLISAMDDNVPAGLAEIIDLERIRHYDQDGDPMTLAEWTVANGRLDWKRVGLLRTDEGIFLSTVWIGIAQVPTPGSTRGVFETMVEEPGQEQEILLHSTRAEAVAAFRDLAAAIEGREVNVVERIENLS